MEPERRYIEEVGEAVEALGIMLEKELGLVQQRLEELYRFMVRIREEEGDLRTESENLKKEIGKVVNSLDKFEKLLTRTEAKLADVQTDVSEQESFFGEMKSELAMVKKELQLFRSDIGFLAKEERRQKEGAEQSENDNDR
jgi:chromosome segregation ATPase